MVCVQLLPFSHSFFFRFANGVEAAMAKGDIPRKNRAIQSPSHHTICGHVDFSEFRSECWLSPFSLLFWPNLCFGRTARASLPFSLPFSRAGGCFVYALNVFIALVVQCSVHTVACRARWLPFFFFTSLLPRMPCWWIGSVQVIYFYKIGNDISCFGLIFLSNGRPYIICYLASPRQPSRRTKARTNTNTNRTGREN